MKPKQNKISPSPHIATAVVSVGSPDYQNFTITDTSHSVRLLWTSDQSLAETSTWQHTVLTTENIHEPGEIRTHNSSKRAAADPRHRSHGHWDQNQKYES